MAGFYHFTDSNTDRTEESGDIFYVLKEPTDALFDFKNECLKPFNKPIVINIIEFGAAFIVPPSAWDGNEKQYSFNINGNVYRINAFFDSSHAHIFIVKTAGR